MTINFHSLHLANPSISMRNGLGLTIPLNGKSYHLNIYYKESDSAQEEEIASSCLNQCKNDFQYLLCRQIKEPCRTISISTSITKSTCKVQDYKGIKKPVTEFSLSESQSSKSFQMFLNKINKIIDTALNLSSSFIKISLKEVSQIRKGKSVEQSTKCINPFQIKGSMPCDSERAIGLDRQENNCCVNATLQIILNNLELRKIWEECFEEIANVYYAALYKGQDSAPQFVGREFRRQLVEKSSSNLIDKDLSVQDDPTAFLEVFFNVCKEEKLDLSCMEINFEKMKYKQVRDGKLEPSILQPENHKHFRISINNQFNQKTNLEELLKKHCLEINEIEENGMNVRYIAKDQYVSLPNHLIIDLFTNNRRDASDVCIPTNFHFSQDLLKNRHSTYTYELEAFIVHLGKTDEDGHYVAYRKVNNQWKKFDDNKVTDVNESQLQKVLGNFQEEKSSDLFHKLLATAKSVLEGSNPYVCILSYSKTLPCFYQ